jgi:Carboxypeptidase regulatory-like domain
MQRTLLATALALFLPGLTHQVSAQSLGNAGTIEGNVVDPSGAAIAKAAVTIHNAVSGYKQATTTASDGSFRFSNIPPNPYHMEVIAPGFNVFTQDVAIRSGVPVQIKATLALAGAKTSVTVEGAGSDILEVDPSAHTWMPIELCC